MVEDNPSDKYLIEQYISGDKTTLVLLVKRYHKTFCNKAFWVLKDKDLSKDVAQESWIIIIKKLHKLKSRDRFKPWALRIIYTKSIDVHKRRNKELQNLQRIEKLRMHGSPDKESMEEINKKLLRAIQDLPKQKQDIIRLFYIEEYSLKEISSFLKTPLGTVKSRLFKAREKLKSIIKSYTYEK